MSLEAAAGKLMLRVFKLKHSDTEAVSESLEPKLEYLLRYFMLLLLDLNIATRTTGSALYKKSHSRQKTEKHWLNRGYLNITKHMYCVARLLESFSVASVPHPELNGL